MEYKKNRILKRKLIICLNIYVTPWSTQGFPKNISHFELIVWPNIANIYKNTFTNHCDFALTS